MSRKNEYREYLKSSIWADHRNLALSRTEGFCQFCGEIATQVHHVIYPKRFGEEHPHSLIPVCDRCHQLSHGRLQMKSLTNAQSMTELTPNGGKLNYLLSNGRVYASAKSWVRALNIPESMNSWFTTGLSRTALLKKDLAGGDLEVLYQDTPVYRWHAVAEQLRAFDREWHKTQFKSRPLLERREIERFQESYEKLVSWGYDLQEKAISSRLNFAPSNEVPLSQEDLLVAIKQAIAPRLQDHDSKLSAHDVVIEEIKGAIPSLRDPEEFITVKQAIFEQGLDPDMMPYHPKSKETLSGVTGQLLTSRRMPKGIPVAGRIEGNSIIKELNTYRRGDIYAAFEYVLDRKQKPFVF